MASAAHLCNTKPMCDCFLLFFNSLVITYTKQKRKEKLQWFGALVEIKLDVFGWTSVLKHVSRWQFWRLCAKFLLCLCWGQAYFRGRTTVERSTTSVNHTWLRVLRRARSATLVLPDTCLRLPPRQWVSSFLCGAGYLVSSHLCHTSSYWASMCAVLRVHPSVPVRSLLNNGVRPAKTWFSWSLCHKFELLFCIVVSNFRSYQCSQTKKYADKTAFLFIVIVRQWITKPRELHFDHKKIQTQQ